ncbi:MAG: hypothetical protein ACJAYC_002623 [Halieaceae bacterium]|jgi:hypothetical protein
MVTDIQILVVSAVFLAGLAIWLYTRKPLKEKLARIKRRRSFPAAFQYSSVSIITPKVCCEAASDFVGVKFLVKNAPKLPLPGCDQAAASAFNRHHADRRDEDAQRRALYGLRSELHPLHTGKERRERKERRVMDFAMA